MTNFTKQLTGQDLEDYLKARFSKPEPEPEPETEPETEPEPEPGFREPTTPLQTAVYAR